MKIAICGKGGSGKSTIAVLLAKALSQRDFKVLVVDSDESNTGLYRKLGFSKAPLPILDMVGGRKTIKERNTKIVIGHPSQKPEILQQKTMRITDIPDENIVKNDGIAFIQIGKINQALEGCACPMGVLNREFLDKLELGEKEVVIVDTEAGLEHFGRGMDTCIDNILILVDPSSESVDFAKKAYDLSKSINIKNIWVILNKINSDSVANKLTDKLKQKNIVPAIAVPDDEYIFEAELDGKPLKGKKSGESIDKLVELMISKG